VLYFIHSTLCTLMILHYKRHLRISNGVIVNNRITFGDHIDAQCKTAMTQLTALKGVQRKIPRANVFSVPVIHYLSLFLGERILFFPCIIYLLLHFLQHFCRHYWFDVHVQHRLFHFVLYSSSSYLYRVCFMMNHDVHFVYMSSIVILRQKSMPLISPAVH
jgi:hypothetical protein